MRHCPITRVQPTIELIHCSTTRDGTATSDDDVRMHQSGTKRLNHPVAGRIEIVFDVLELPGDPGLSITTYSAEPGAAKAAPGPGWLGLRAVYASEPEDFRSCPLLAGPLLVGAAGAAP
jgi:hypothetical protein